MDPRCSQQTQHRPNHPVARTLLFIQFESESAVIIPLKVGG